MGFYLLFRASLLGGGVLCNTIVLNCKRGSDMTYRKTTFNDLHIKIADRYSDLFKSLDLGYVPEKIDILISLGYSPLSESDLQRLLDGSDEDLAHDVSGINSHISRETKLMDETFVPRCMR